MKRIWNKKVIAMVLVAGFLASAAWSVQSVRLLTFTILPQAAAAGAPVCIDLSPAAGNQPLLTFATPAPSRLIIRFHAECSVGGPDTNYADDNIIIDPAGAGAPFVAVPTNSDNALCSGNGTATFNDAWVSASSQAIAAVPAGVHTIQVCIAGIGAGANWRIDDTSLTVESDP